MESFVTPIKLITSSIKALGDMYLEDKIIHQMMEIAADKGFEQINLSNAHFYLSLPSGNKMLHPLLEVLTVESLVDLYFKASKLLIGASIRHITGVCIHFGFDGNDIRLLYQPVIMKWERFDGVTMDDIYNIEVEKNEQGEPKFYCYNSGAFALIDLSVATTYKSDYQKYIQIKHNLDVSEPHRSFSSKDIGSIIVAFQTIFSLLVREDSDELILHNSIRKMKENLSDNIRHSILMSTVPIVLGQNSNHQFSNRSHLCPPCTVQVGYDIAE